MKPKSSNMLCKQKTHPTVFSAWKPSQLTHDSEQAIPIKGPYQT